jgi:presenilin-like A22 family membrane protease
VCRKFRHEDREKSVATDKYYMLLSLLFVEILLIQTKDYTHFLSSVIVVKIFHSFYYCYFLLLLLLSLFLLFPYHVFSILSSVCFCKLHKPPKYPSPLLLQFNHTLDLLHLNCATVCISAVTNLWPNK